MAKRRTKKRTHQPPTGPNGTTQTTKPGSRTPKSMVIRMGGSAVGPSISQLVKDVRRMMEPETASRLRERRSNKLRDFTSMAGPLGVSHLLLFSRSGSGNVNLRLAVTPRGPTLHFRVEEYSLCKDVFKSQRRPRGGGMEFVSAPLLVMNNFSSAAAAEQRREEVEMDGEEKQQQQKQVPKHLEALTTSIFQSLFPAINPTTTPLKNIKRVLLLDRAPPPSSSTHNNNTEDSTPPYLLNLRHYAIETRTAKSVPKPLRRLETAQKAPSAGSKRKRGSALPDLGRMEDVADYLLDPSAADGFTSGSDSEPETDAEVEVLAPVTQKVGKKKQARKPDAENRREERGKARVEKKGIKLHELGPRLRLRLTKVEEGLCGGKVMWHQFIEKSEEEVRELERVHDERRRVKEERRRRQKEDVERKKRAGKVENGEEEDDEDNEMEDDFMDDDDNFEDVDEDEDAEMEDGAEDGGG